ncbi:MAG TPA: hypothetical protein DCS93_19840 [Microscillaceae bacterium]|nr:hypothetical protein [Microscillaceae bacterium]
MAYSDEDLDKYLKKAQEVLNSKNEDYLNEEDLQDIAQKLGLNMQEIAQAKEDYLVRGNNHLNFGNYQEAISEYEQLLLLAPKDPKGLYGLAKAHLEKWHQDGKKANKEKALEYANNCIENDPKFQEAYAIISELKQKPQGNRKKTAQSAKKTPQKPAPKKKSPKPAATKKSKRRKPTQEALGAILVIGVVLAVQIGVSFYKSKGTSQYMVGTTKQGIVVWQVKYTKYDKRPYYRKPKLLIAQASTGKLLKEIDLPAREKVDGDRLWHKTKIINGSFYDYYKDSFIARDILTGEITDSKALLVQKFPQIGAGIGKIQHRNNNWFKITSKQGSEHWYNPATQKLLNNDEYRQQNQIRTPFWQYQWVKIENPENRNQYKFLLTQQLSRRSYRNKQGISGTSDQYLQNNINKGYTRMTTKSEKANFFLKPKVIYSDSTHILFKYKTEIGKQGAFRLACIGKSGDVLWEKGFEDLENPLLKNFLTQHSFKSRFARYKNELGISNTRVSKVKKRYPLYKMAIGVDLNTGKVLWKHSPRLYDTKFK